MRTAIVAACLVTLTQGQAPPSSPSFVTVEVTVAEGGGRPVRGLAAADFEVRLNGRVQLIRSAVPVPPNEPMAGAVGPSFDAAPLPDAAVYRLNVEAPAGMSPAKEITVAARVVNRAGVTTSAIVREFAAPAAVAGARAAASSAPDGTLPPAEQMRRAIVTGRTLSGIDVSLEHSIRRADDPSQIAIDLVVAIPAAAKPPLKTTFALVDTAGAIRTTDKTIENATGDGAYRIALSVPVAPGAYKLRFAAADATGAVGSIESRVDASLTPMGPFQASGIAIAPLPGSARGILVSLELYPAADAPSDVVVKIALLAGGELLNERAIVPEPADGALRAEAEFALSASPPDAYIVRAVVVSGATVLGTTTRPLPR